jgi:hypothetical protein
MSTVYTQLDSDSKYSSLEERHRTRVYTAIVRTTAVYSCTQLYPYMITGSRFFCTGAPEVVCAFEGPARLF